MFVYKINKTPDLNLGLLIPDPLSFFIESGSRSRDGQERFVSQVGKIWRWVTRYDTNRPFQLTPYSVSPYIWKLQMLWLVMWIMTGITHSHRESAFLATRRLLKAGTTVVNWAVSTLKQTSGCTKYRHQSLTICTPPSFPEGRSEKISKYFEPPGKSGVK